MRILQEKRQLRFWFQKKVNEEETQTDKFLQELLNPKSFPKGTDSIQTALLCMEA